MTRIVESGNYFKFVLGSPMPNTVRVVGVLLQLAGGYHIASQPLVSIGIILLGFFASYQKQGVEIDLGNNLFRFYHAFVGMKTGKWIDLDTFPYLAILNRRTSQRIFGFSAAYYSKQKDFYSVVLMDKTHRTRYALLNIKGAEQAKKKAIELAKKLNRELVPYNPRVSAKTQARRSR